MIVVADLHKLNNRVKEEYQVDGSKQLERAGMKVEQSYVDHVNANSKVSGKLFIVDEKATEEWTKKRDENTEAKKLRAAKEKLGITEQAEALIEKSKAPRKGRPAKTEE